MSLINLDEIFSNEGDNGAPIDWVQLAKDAGGGNANVKLEKSDFKHEGNNNPVASEHYDKDMHHTDNPDNYAYDLYNLDSHGSHHIHQVLIDHQIQIDWQP